jgi:hypothetical protein
MMAVEAMEVEQEAVEGLEALQIEKEVMEIDQIKRMHTIKAETREQLRIKRVNPRNPMDQ